MEVEMENLTAIRILGRGALGTVFLVKHRLSTGNSRNVVPFALKVIDKSLIRSRADIERRSKWELSVLSQLPKHPFLPCLLATVENSNIIAYGIPYCSGGDLNYLHHLQIDRIFSVSVIRFYIAEIITALETLHQMSIVYRDLKPENVLIQSNGHIMLTDFDLSRRLIRRKQTLSEAIDLESEYGHKPRRKLTRMVSAISERSLKKAKSARVLPVTRRKGSFCTGERSNSFVGTEEYVSPEVVRGDGHEFSVDWWALGVLTYEMMYGRTPFRGRNRKETFRNVLTKPPEFVGNRTELTDLISRLLEKDPWRRLGYHGGAAEIKQHAFFTGLRWDLLTDISRPPFLHFKEQEDNVLEKGINICDYLRNQRPHPSPSSSSSPESPYALSEKRKNVSLTDF